MKTIKTEFPNPVLAAGRDDYIKSCNFYTKFNEHDISVDDDNITITVEYTLKCNGLQKLIEKGEAAVIIMVRSAAASYSRLFRFSADSLKRTIEIPKFDVINSIKITGSVIAAQDIEKFSCPGEFNDLYFGSSTFEIRKGDILATEDAHIIPVDDSELEKPITSIFRIAESDDNKDDVNPDFEDDKIVIYLKKDLYELYYKFKDLNNGALLRYLHAVIVYPVLVEAVAYVAGHYQASKNGTEDTENDEAVDSERRWFRVIEKKARDLGFNLREDDYDKNNTTLADRLLGGIALDALKDFGDLLDLDSETNSDSIQTNEGDD